MKMNIAKIIYYHKFPKHGRWLRRINQDDVCFFCPSCQEYHVINHTWEIIDHEGFSFTIKPSVKVSINRPKKDAEGKMLMNPDGTYVREDITLCHLNIKNATIYYCEDHPKTPNSSVSMIEEPE